MIRFHPSRMEEILSMSLGPLFCPIVIRLRRKREGLLLVVSRSIRPDLGEGFQSFWLIVPPASRVLLREFVRCAVATIDYDLASEC